MAIAAVRSRRLSGIGCRPPLGVHVEQVHEEVVGQRTRPVGEDTSGGLPGVRTEDTQATHEHGHLRSAQCQHQRPLDQQDFGRDVMTVSDVVAEPVSRRLQDSERLLVGLLLRRIRASRRKGTFTS